MSKEKTRFTLRIDTDLFEIVKQNAVKNKRSAAMEIEYALDEYYHQKSIPELLKYAKERYNTGDYVPSFIEKILNSSDEIQEQSHQEIDKKPL